VPAESEVFCRGDGYALNLLRKTRQYNSHCVAVYGLSKLNATLTYIIESSYQNKKIQVARKFILVLVSFV